jgi:hypothetical protein
MWTMRTALLLNASFSAVQLGYLSVLIAGKTKQAKKCCSPAETHLTWLESSFRQHRISELVARYVV